MITLRRAPPAVRLAACVLMGLLILQPKQITAAPPSGYELIFTDEFNGDTLDTSKWQDKYPWSREHNDAAYMAPENVILGDGTVTLLAERESHPNSSRPFTSGAISTGYSKFIFTGGYVEARVLLPDTPGSWPAFWGLYTGWPPEADIMEYPIRAEAGKGYLETEYHTAWHYSTGSGNSAGAGKVNPSGVGDLGGTYHTFAMEWIEDDWVGYYFDGQLVSQFGDDAAISQMEYMYLIVNYAVGGWPGMPTQSQWADGHSDEFKIDWVRVWQQTDAKDTRYVDSNGNGFGEWTDNANWSAGAPTQGDQIARFGTQVTGAQTVEWDKVRTIGRVYLDGDTNVTLGEGDESLLIAMSSSDEWSHIWVDGGDGSHTINSRLEAWSNLSIANQRGGDLTLNGDLISQADGDLGGSVMLSGSQGQFGGEIIVNGDFHQQEATTISSAADVSLTGGFYQTDHLRPDAVLSVTEGSILRVNNLHTQGEGGAERPLGYLRPEQDRLVLDGGTVQVTGSAATARGFTIGAGGATVLVNGRNATLSLLDSPNPQQQIKSDEGGDLTLGGTHAGFLHKSLGGAGGLSKADSGTWVLSAANNYTGATRITDGTLSLTGSASIAASSVIDVQPAGTLDVSALNTIFTLASGQRLNNDSLATVVGDVVAGTASVVSGEGRFANSLTAASGSSVQPGSQPSPSSIISLGELVVDGDYTQQTGAELQIELFSTSLHDALSVGGVFTAGGVLRVTLTPDAPALVVGDAFDILDFASADSQFDSVLLPELSTGMFWGASDLMTTGELRVVTLSGLIGDYNNDGLVDASDYAVWRGNLDGSNLLNRDPSNTGLIGPDDYASWRANYGAPLPQMVVIENSAVPELSAWVLAVVLGAVAPRRARRV